ncbi:TetR/AcrR family transcriptional regulator [Bosea sp. 2KB_26]|uniref:TetR/AcrR family transcriptional regulator n=1 Tax=Bosea sp. 2KB_26 TaxID=3237475 RepID=UPI003F909DA9
MPRVVKHPDDRRNELLDCAQALFFERGYERTTINDVIARAGISKGGFYHHFTAKEDLLTALATRLAQASVERLEDVTEAPDLAPLARLNGFLARARQIKLEDAPRLRATFDVLFKPENIVLYHRINATVIPLAVPVLTRIIAAGKAEGVFKVPDAGIAAEIVLHLSATSRDAMARAISASGTPDAPAAIDALDQQLRFQGIAIDRILGLPDGSVTYVEDGFVQAIMTAQ